PAAEGIENRPSASVVAWAWLIWRCAFGIGTRESASMTTPETMRAGCCAKTAPLWSVSARISASRVNIRTGLQLVEHQVHDHAGDRDIQPQRQRPSRD